MEKFNYGVMVIDPLHSEDDENLPVIYSDGDINVIHFVGFWEKPKEDDFIHLYEEFKTDENFGLIDIANRLKLFPATQDCIDHFNSIINFEEDDSEETDE